MQIFGALLSPTEAYSKCQGGYFLASWFIPEQLDSVGWDAAYWVAPRQSGVPNLTGNGSPREQFFARKEADESICLTNSNERDSREITGMCLEGDVLLCALFGTWETLRPLLWKIHISVWYWYQILCQLILNILTWHECYGLGLRDPRYNKTKSINVMNFHMRFSDRCTRCVDTCDCFNLLYRIFYNRV